MRTTITLEPDVRALIRGAMKERGISFKEALNSAVRAGLTQGKPMRRYFVQQSFSLGSDQNFTWDKALEAATALALEQSTGSLRTAVLPFEKLSTECGSPHGIAFRTLVAVAA
jgi:hypothetical protein